jgi:hypothetical protein
VTDDLAGVGQLVDGPGSIDSGRPDDRSKLVDAVTAVLR